MSTLDVAQLVRSTLFDVAPDLSDQAIDPALPFRDQFDFDSMDFMHFVTGLHQKTKLEIPERDYPILTSLDACVRYLQGKGVGK
jgi:acyl carrier protein